MNNEMSVVYISCNEKEVDSTGRRLDISAEKWMVLVAEFRKSDLPLKTFAATKEVNPHAFRYWTNDRERAKRQKCPNFYKVLPSIRKIGKTSKKNLHKATIYAIIAQSN